MADPVIVEPITQTPPVVTTTSPTPDPTQTATIEPTGDILTRVAQKKAPPKPEDIAGTFKIFDDIVDPVQREKLISREKERIADYTRKTQELAHQRQEFERFQQESKNWTPDRIQRELLNNPQFVQSAQQVAAIQNPAGSGLTDEQFSALTPGEKNQLTAMNQQIGELRQQNFFAAVSQKNTLLSSKYGDYDSLKINQAYKDLASMNAIDTLEHVYKSVYHDDHVRAAYEEGKKDASTLNQTRVQASTQPGFNTQPASTVPKKEAKETDMAYFQRLANRRIEERKGLLAQR